MGYLQQVVKSGPSRYTLPKVGSMRCEVHAFLSEVLFAQTAENLWQQAADSASTPGAIGMYLMPDTHLGYHLPVGGVLVTEDVILQAGSGYDISCFTADTKVSLVDGRELTFLELVSLYGEGDEFYVYSMTSEGRVTAGRAHSPRLTRKGANLVEVELDNGEKVRCTPDHEWMLRDGTYCQAQNLTAGASLMPLYRSYERDGYCDVQHPVDNSLERMYKVAFREVHGYVPAWPNVLHHDIFNAGNPNPSKLNDDPRYLVEMNENDHWRLHSENASTRAKNGEIGWGRLHQLRPGQMSEMSSANMTRLHADPAFQARHAKRASVMNRKCRAEGLIRYNQSEQGRAKSRANGTLNRGRNASDATRAKLRAAHAKAKTEILPCPHCPRQCQGKGGLGRHVAAKHNNHKVVSVRVLTEREDVYCLTVEKYANFALASGVFVHNCGVVYLQVPGLSAVDVVDWDKRMKWVRAVESRIAMGVGQGSATIKGSRIEEVLRYGAKAIGVGPDLCERQYIPIPDSFDLTSIEKARDKAGPQLGSVGGGNHFIEMQVDAKDGSVWVMVHCGSRGFGWQAANHFFYEVSRLRGLPPNRREESWVRRDEPMGEEYWNWHNAAANYAVANRWTIVQGVQEALQAVFGVRAKPYYEISHNLVQEETVVLPDGTSQRGFVHRKGATRAFPAGHPDLVGTKWSETGHPCLIPGSMLAGAAIMFPLKGAYESGCSVNHGSGRLMARGEAKRELSAIHDDIDAEMRDIVRTFDTSQGPIQIKGIVGNTERTPIDECGHVYKDLDEVLGVLVDEKVARIERRLYPVANLKGCD